MRNQFHYEEELLCWRERMHILRQTYSGIPGGYSSAEEAEKAFGVLSGEKAEFLERSNPGFEEDALQRWRQFAAGENVPFVGRKRELQQIRERFDSGVSPVFLYGIGGSGKTALARAYAGAYRQQYEQIIMLTYQGSLMQLFCDDYLVPVKGFQYQKDRYQNQSRYYSVKMKEIERIVEKHRTLLIIDDWNRPEPRRQKSVLSLPCDVLITTRTLPDVWGAGTGILVDAFQTEEEWREFYGICGSGVAPSEAEEIRRRTGGHILGMLLYFRTCCAPDEVGSCASLAGSTKQYGLDGSVRAQEVLGEGLSAKKPKQSMTESLPDMLEDLLSKIPLRETEKQMLRELSVLPVQGISWDQFRAASGATEKTLQSLSEKLFVQITYERDDFPVWISMHPVIAEAVKRIFRPTGANCRRLMRGFSERAKDAWLRPMQENQKDVAYVFSLLRAFPEPEAWMASIYDGLLILLMMQEYDDEVIPQYQKLLAVVMREHGKMHQMTGEMQLRMAAAYFNAQDYEAAVPWYQNAYDTLKRCKSYDSRRDHLMAEAAGKMSRVCRGRKDYQEALKYIREALSYEERAVLYQEKLRTGTTVQQIDHLETLSAYLTYYFWTLDLGKIYIRTGNCQEAERCLTRVCHFLERDARARRMFTETFTRTELDKYKLELLTAEERFHEAEVLAEEMLQYALDTRGPVHAYTLGIRLRIADLWQTEGFLSRAEAEYRAILCLLKEAHPYWTEQIRRTEERIFGVVTLL